MKRWIHAATDVPEGWDKDYNDDLGYYYYFKEDNGLKATMHWEDNDGDGYYAVSIFRPGQSGFVARKNIYPLEKAFDYADNILSDPDKANVQSSTKVTASTQDTISELEDRIADLEAEIELAKQSGYEPEDLIDMQLELEELKDELRFAWADDEAEYNYAVQQQEFNPDGSLKYY